MSVPRARIRSAALVGALMVLLAAPPARADLHEASVGNYYFEDDVAKDRERLIVDQGDQIRFTVREAAYPPHSINVDELGISSPDLLLFDTFTTPPLDRPGSYKLYCRPHEERGHVTTLVVRAAPRSTTAPPTTTSAAASSTTAPDTDTSETTEPGAGPEGPTDSAPADPGAGLAPTTSDETVPSGVGKATDRRRAPPDPDSLAGLLGRRPGAEGPWTRSLWLAVAALVGLATAAVGAVEVGRRRQRGMGP